MALKPEINAVVQGIAADASLAMDANDWPQVELLYRIVRSSGHGRAPDDAHLFGPTGRGSHDQRSPVHLQHPQAGPGPIPAERPRDRARPLGQGTLCLPPLFLPSLPGLPACLTEKLTDASWDECRLWLS